MWQRKWPYDSFGALQPYAYLMSKRAIAAGLTPAASFADEFGIKLLAFQQFPLFKS
jgi:hypothetical protein